MKGKPQWVLAAALAVSITAMGFTCTVEDECETNDDCDTAAGEVCVDGDCVVPEDVILQWDWTIEGHTYTELGDTEFERFCSWSNYWEPASDLVIRLLVDTDHDGTEDYFYDAECQWGSAQTEPASDPASYQPGDVVWFYFQMIDYTDTIVAQSLEYVEVTLANGVNDLGTVDYDWGDFGPLDVTIGWADKEADPAYGDCDGPPVAVDIMGYLLRYSDGSTADEVNITTDPMACTTDLSWIETDFDIYVLVLDGENTADYWAATCIDLEVDDETSNQWGCDVEMNPI